MKFNRNEDKKDRFQIFNKFMVNMKNKNIKVLDEISMKLLESFDFQKMSYVSSEKIYQKFLNEIKEMSKICLVRSKRA